MKVYSIPSDVELQEVQKIPSMENYEGIVLATIDGVTQHHEIDVAQVLGGKAVVFNSSQSIFLFNCAHGLWQNKSYKRQIEAGEPLTQGVEKIVDDTIENYFDGNFVPPAPEPEPEPEPEPVSEPEPSDFEVETWVPQDEFPDNGE
jgi:hypothetical protein